MTRAQAARIQSGSPLVAKVLDLKRTDDQTRMLLADDQTHDRYGIVVDGVLPKEFETGTVVDYKQERKGSFLGIGGVVEQTVALVQGDGALKEQHTYLGKPGVAEVTHYF